MNAQTRIEPDNLAIWNAVCETDPRHTKHVNQRGGFTAISANYQVMLATKQFGPIGIGWGYDCGEPVFHDTLVLIPVTFWHGNRANRFGPIYGCEEWKDNKGRIDSDATKKAETDGLTKALSRLGFNADVFMGLFDDQKYVEQVRRKYEGAAEPVGAIDDAQWAMLAQLIQAAGVTPTTVCTFAKVERLEDLTTEKFASVVKKLNATIKAKADKQAEPA